MVRWAAIAGTVALAFAAGVVGYQQLNQPLSLARLLTSPQDYDGRRVEVAGTVAEGAALLGIGGYRLADGDLSLLVLTDSAKPPEGERVRVSGTFKQALSVGSLQYSVLLRIENAAVLKLLLPGGALQ